MTGTNPLISPRPSDSGLHVHLHPLVLLSISDHITRHAARQQSGPVIGAILGQQNGREITMEHVFECHTVAGTNGETMLHGTWFDDRLKQFKDVHKDPALDLVGWFTVMPPSGPEPFLLPIHRQILQAHNESAVLLGFHAADISSASRGGKLPLTIYESVYEADASGDADRPMQIDGQEPLLNIRFRELPYSIDTGEAEMISVDFVARGGGNATAVPALSSKQSQSAASTQAKKKKKGEKATEEEISGPRLSAEDEDVIANLTTRLNAVKTLESRIRLIKAYLTSVQSASESSPEATKEASQLSNTLLRDISSLTSHLSLLNPQDSSEFSTESLAQANDVALASLLGSLGKSVQEMRELGRKFAIVDGQRQTAANRKLQAALHGRMDEEYLTDRPWAGGQMGV